jgi:probable F420-dependent oxidoreductase
MAPGAVSIVPPGRLAYGIQLPVQTLTLTLREEWEVGAGVDDLVAVAKAADAAGFAFVGVCDHVALPRNDYTAHMSTTWYDTVATLGFLAAHTANVRLLSEVFVPALRHPLLTAKAFLTLDHLSGGRAILGAGAGHVQSEFDALGIDFTTRGARMNEVIDAVRAAFASEYSSFSGAYFDYPHVGLSPRPARGSIPIWIGGSTRPALRRVAERGDGWIPQGTPRAEMQGCIDTIRAHLDEVRPGTELDLGFMSEFLYVGNPSWDTGGHSITGPPERHAASLREARTFGCNVLHLHFRSRDRHELVDQITAFGRDVAPLLDE